MLPRAREGTRSHAAQRHAPERKKPRQDGTRQPCPPNAAFPGGNNGAGMTAGLAYTPSEMPKRAFSGLEPTGGVPLLKTALRCPCVAVRISSGNRIFKRTHAPCRPAAMPRSARPSASAAAGCSSASSMGRRGSFFPASWSTASAERSRLSRFLRSRSACVFAGRPIMPPAAS